MKTRMSASTVDSMSIVVSGGVVSPANPVRMAGIIVAACVIWVRASARVFKFDAHNNHSPHMPTHVLETRWQRLERYARWRQRLLSPLRDLPDDLVEYLCAFLSHSDLTRLLIAYTGTSLTHRRDLSDIPPFIQDRWIAQAAYDQVYNTVLQCSEVACYHCDYTEWISVHVHADWSAFTPQYAQSSAPLARYRWVEENGCHRWTPNVNHAAISELVWRMMRDGRCACRFSLHSVVSTVILSDELFAKCVTVFPHTMLRCASDSYGSSGVDACAPNCSACTACA